MVRRNEFPKFASLVTGRGEIFFYWTDFFYFSPITKKLFHSWSYLELSFINHVEFKEQSHEGWFIFIVTSVLRRTYGGGRRSSDICWWKFCLGQCLHVKFTEKSTSDLGGDESDSELRNWLFLKLLRAKWQVI